MIEPTLLLVRSIIPHTMAGFRERGLDLYLSILFDLYCSGRTVQDSGLEVMSFQRERNEIGNHKQLGMPSSINKRGPVTPVTTHMNEINSRASLLNPEAQGIVRLFILKQATTSYRS